MKLENMIAAIAPLDESAMQAARARQDRLTKPPGSLGRLEEIAVRVAGITGQPLPILEKKAILVLAGDHGVVEEGVSAYPQEVTGQMVRNFLAGGAAINVLARHIGAAKWLDPSPDRVVVSRPSGRTGALLPAP